MNEFEITETDIRVILDIITAMAGRGAIRPQELSVIGRVYDKYLGILEKVQKQQIAGIDNK